MRIGDFLVARRKTRLRGSSGEPNEWTAGKKRARSMQGRSENWDIFPTMSFRPSVRPFVRAHRFSASKNLDLNREKGLERRHFGRHAQVCIQG